ncbi:AAA family ATPase [Streptomyces sp. NPDC047928]|uniref:helix-turn-helix transcriptional regulator n=1 Tax=unclassified Streptomyces TaxID=2593676 RepID=UPI00371C88B8
MDRVNSARRLLNQDCLFDCPQCRVVAAHGEQSLARGSGTRGRARPTGGGTGLLTRSPLPCDGQARPGCRPSPGPRQRERGDLTLRTARASLVGRDSTLSELRATLTTTVEGTGGCLVIEGPAGIGKSRLLDVITAEAEELGMLVAVGRAAELDRVAPLTPLLTALRRGELPGLDIAALGSAGGDRFWLIDELRDLIESCAHDRPMLIVLDDAQWADELTALALRILVPELFSSPVLWLLARRPVPARSAAQDAIEWLIGECAQRVPLGPLGDDAVAELSSRILGAAPDPSVLALADRAGGNPFLLEQLLITVRNAGRVLIADGAATVVSGGLPADFLGAVHHRMKDLSPEARRLVEVASVFGRPFTMHEAAGLVGCSATGLVLAVEEALKSGTLVEQGTDLAFSHDLIREAVYEKMYESVRLALHREAAVVVREEGRSPIEVAEHLIRSGHAGDGQALTVLREAATDIAPHAPGTAADLILRMLKLIDAHDPSRAGLTADAVRLLACAGRLREAQELGESALSSGLDARTEAALLLGLSEALKHAGQNAAVIRYTRRALARRGVPDASRAQLLAIQAHALLYVGDLDGADRAGAEAAALAAACGEDSASALVFGTVARSVAARGRGDLDASVSHAVAAVEAADRGGGEVRHRHPRLWLARGLVTVDRFDEADMIYLTGQREATQLGTAWSQPLWHYYRAELRMLDGRLAEAEAEAEAGLRITQQLQALQLTVPLLGLLAQMAIRRGELSVARGHLRQINSLVEDGISVGPAEQTWPTALFHEAVGDHHAALDTLTPVLDRTPERMLLLANDPGAAPVLVRIAMRAGASALDRAEAVVVAAESLRDRNPGVASIAGAAAHARGLLLGDLEALRLASSHFRASPRLLARAAAFEDTALAEHTAGNRERAVALMEEAVAQYTASGTERDAARAAKSLRGFGVRSKVTNRDAIGTLPARSTLTRSELRVAQLVTEGLTNREVANQLYLSPHTVDSHLRHVFAKLGVHSRVELTRRFAAYLEESGETAQTAGAA